MVYDKKDDLKNLQKEIEYPFEASNFNRKKKVCNTKEELLKHLLCRDELKPITLILSSKIHPEYFIEEKIFEVISLYVRAKRYGYNFIFNGYDDIPNSIMESFDIISGVIEKDESDKIKSIKENNKQQDSKKHNRKK